jgi:hypothetical protein
MMINDEHDMIQETILFPWVDDAPMEGDDTSEHDGEVDEEEGEDEPNDSMDGDHDSAMASAGFGTDEDYGYFGGNEDY